jgi:ABC-type dipeptide/oligopeptide/nickel transport system permease component
MGQYVVRRLLYMVVVILVVSVITFGLMHAIPGGPFTSYVYAILIPHFTTTPPANSLDDDFLINVKVGPIWIRWMNFGPSYRSRSRTVNDIFRDNLPISGQLGVMALMIAVVIGMPLGIMAALKQNTLFDYFGMGIAIFGVSVPVIVLGPIFVWVFGVALKWFPPTGWGAKPPWIFGFLPSSFGWEYFKYTIMPSVALGLGSSAVVARLTRATLLQTVREDYIRTARSKGLHERMIIMRHALKNSLIPVVTILGPLFAALVTGTFVTELMFGIPGMGRYFVTSITNRDYPVIMGTILLYAVFLVVANLLVDIAYAYLDPRIRYD